MCDAIARRCFLSDKRWLIMGCDGAEEEFMKETECSLTWLRILPSDVGLNQNDAPSNHKEWQLGADIGCEDPKLESILSEFELILWSFAS